MVWYHMVCSTLTTVQAADEASGLVRLDEVRGGSDSLDRDVCLDWVPKMRPKVHLLCVVHGILPMIPVAMVRRYRKAQTANEGIMNKWRYPDLLLVYYSHARIYGLELVEITQEHPHVFGFTLFDHTGINEFVKSRWEEQVQDESKSTNRQVLVAQTATRSSHLAHFDLQRSVEQSSLSTRD